MALRPPSKDNCRNCGKEYLFDKTPWVGWCSDDCWRAYLAKMKEARNPKKRTFE